MGIPIIFVWLKTKEPKRGAAKAELKALLAARDVEYRYRLTRETVKATVLSNTNLFAMLEGIFTQAILAVPWFLAFPFFQSDPYNISPLSMSFILIIFGIPAGFIGSTILAKKSDDFGKKAIKNRIYIIFIALLAQYLFWLGFVSIPYAPLDTTQGAQLGTILSHPIYWLGGLMLSFASLFGPLFSINQRPLIQRINLPEAQGLISGANILFEQVGRGIGMILSGSLLLFFNYDYVMTVFILVLMGVFGATLWLLNLRWINKDVSRISDILEKRNKELERHDNAS